MKLPPRIANADGTPTLEFITLWDELNFGSRETSLGSIVSGINGIVNGTTPLADVIIAGVGSVANGLAATAAGVDAVANANTGFAATTSPTEAFVSSASPGLVTTNTVTASPSGGTGPYTYSWAIVSGDSFTVLTGTTATASFRIGLASGDSASAIARVTITDSTSATASRDVAVTAYVEGGS